MPLNTSKPSVASLPKIWNQTITAADSPAQMRFQYTVNVTGGTAGWVIPNLWTNTIIGAGDVGNYVWGHLSQLSSQATSGQHVAVYGQATKTGGGTAEVWGGCFEARDRNNTASNVSGSIVGIEVDVGANGADPGSTRVVIDVVGCRNDNALTTPDIGYGVRVGPQNQVTTNAIFKKAFAATGVVSDAAFDATGATLTGAMAFKTTGWSVDSTGKLAGTVPAAAKAAIAAAADLAALKTALAGLFA